MIVPRSAFGVRRFEGPGLDPAPPTRVVFPTRNAERGARVWVSLLLVTLTLAGSLPAQSDSLMRRSSPVAVKYGKWALVAAAIGMGVKAASDHDAADRAFNRLTDYCGGQPNGCAQAPGGKYFDPVAEGYYQSSLSLDRHARGWLLGGEVTMLGAVGLFVWELSRPKSLPKNIPFEPEIRWTGRDTRVGLKMEF
jgi:hypothetical protein